MWEALVLKAGEALVKLGLKKKAEADESKVKAMEKSVESVGESLGVEKAVRDKQKDVDRNATDVTTEDGGLNFEEKPTSVNPQVTDASKPEKTEGE